MDDTLVATVLIGLAAWRVAFLIVFEDGPFDSFGRLRRLVGVPLEGEISGFLPGVFSCVHCMSFWTVAGFAGLYLLEPRAVIPFAAWGVVLAVHTAVRA